MQPLEKPEGRNSDGTEQAFFLCFGIGDSRFLLPIEDVLEVCEFTAPKPFPIQTPGYLGVINLRGNVIPMLSIAHYLKHPELELNSLKQPSRESKLILLGGNQAERICIFSDTVRKIALHRGITAGMTVNVSGKPVQTIERGAFIRTLGAGCAT